MARASWLIPLKKRGVAIGVICWPNSGNNGELAAAGANSDTEETAGLGTFGFQSVAASCEKETARGSFGLSVWFSDPLLNRSIICLIGVIPAMGSFENGKLKAIAPTSLPSMNTGGPDMPPKTPGLSALAPLNCAMIEDCLGPGNPGKTPRISTPKSSGCVPLKTVFAVPFMPGRISSSGNNAGPLVTGAVSFWAFKEGHKTKAKKIAKTGANLFIKDYLKCTTDCRDCLTSNEMHKACVATLCDYKLR